MTRMNCKLKKPDGNVCGVEIDYDPNTKTAKNAVDGTDHFHAKKKNFTSGKAIPIETELEFLAKISNLQGDVQQLKITTQRLDAEIKTLKEERE